MRSDLTVFLSCPVCGGALTLTDAREERGEIESGTLVCRACPASHPIVDFIPRFVPAENYARNFGFQWNRFSKTQLDSHTGVPISRQRLFASTGWAPEDLAGKRVLDVGCGAGRFTEVALSTGARVVAVDYSSAVDACFNNFSPQPRLDIIQADVYALPFRPAQFDFIYCLGVLQHTPDVKRAFMKLPALLKEGGRITVDVYPKLPLNALWPKYWLRPLTRRMEPERLLRLVERLLPFLLPVSDLLSSIPLVGRKLRWVVPVANQRPTYPQLNRQQIREWALLDTFDMFGPAYDNPQSRETLSAWAEEAGLRDVKVYRDGQMIARGTR